VLYITVVISILANVEGIIKKLKSDKEKKLYHRIDEVLHYMWDPVGASGTPEARDEYYSYLPQVFTLLKNGATEVEIEKHLTTIENESIGVGGSDNKNVANTLVLWKETLLDE
jgi:hypothetical protein